MANMVTWALTALHCFVRICISLSVHADCDMYIRPSTVADSWQSSSYLDYNKLTCFKNSSDCAGASCSYTFLHTAASKPGVGDGFHWFAVKLKQLTLVTAVTIKSRSRDSGFDDELMRHLSRRSDGIEIWTSSGDIDFGPDHCSSRDISVQFSGTKTDKWKFCGASIIDKNLTESQQLKVSCVGVHLTRLILLRKFVDNETQEQRRYMSFSDMLVSTLDVRTELHPAGPLVQNSSVNVSCLLNCKTSDQKPPSLSLCHPNGQCFISSETRIDLVQPSDAGNFTCQIDGQVASSGLLTVQHPPSELRISPPGTIECHPTLNPVFSFTTSAAEPPPEHLCFRDTKTGRSNLTRVSQHVVRLSGEVQSQWVCISGGPHKLTVHCVAMQKSLWTSRASVVWQCSNAGWHSQTMIYLLVAGTGAAAIVFCACLAFNCKTLSSKRKARREAYRKEDVYEMVLTVKDENIYDQVVTTKCQ